MALCHLSQFFNKGGELVNCDKLIRGGFSFCGVDIADIGLSYAPEKENTYVYRPADVGVHQETFDGHDGGYFYGVTRQPKEFTLKCYFEEESIDRGIMEQIYHLFRAGKSGKLIFSRKPWCYYYATVTSLPHPELSNYLNGTITITMTASYPYARGEAMYYNPRVNRNRDLNIKVLENDLVLVSTALVEKEDMVPLMSFDDLSLVHTEPATLILHNPGTEYAPLSITLSGNVNDGLIIRNKTTRQECRIVAVDEAHTVNVQKYVHIDGLNGNTTLIGEEYSEPAFVYHDSGFIQLAPAYPAIRDIYISKLISPTEIRLLNILEQDVVGNYIFVDNAWHKITAQNKNVLTVEDNISAISRDRTMITRMNELEIEAVSTASISHISFSYKPTYA